MAQINCLEFEYAAAMTEPSSVPSLCIACSYDLTRLPSGAACPECGLPIEISSRGDLLEFRLPSYIARLRRGALLLYVSLQIFGIPAAVAILIPVIMFS